MKKLIMCQGLPGSGKTTWAQDEQSKAIIAHGANWSDKPPIIRVNKDDIRRELESSGWTWSREREVDVVSIRDSRIRQAFGNGAITVISDDTNLDRAHRKQLAQLAQEFGAEFVVKKFDTPIEECIRRDSLRIGKARVGEAVIRKFADRHHWGQAPDYSRFARVTPDELLRPALICDLDGTLALNHGRSFYDASTCDRDAINKPVLDVIRAYHNNWAQIIYLSGREDAYREPTERFFKIHHCPPGPLHMRATGDHRKDWIVKGELFDAHVRGKYDVRFVLDDRNQVVNMWRAIGLTCFQVAPGDF